MRYFDLRAGWDNSTNTWVTFHYLVGSPINEILGNISFFMKEFQSEIIIVEISHFDGNPTETDVQKLRDLVLEILGSYIFPIDLSFNFTISDMVNSGKRAIITMESGFEDDI